MKSIRTRPVRIRRRWPINPKTRVVESGQIYKRSKAKKVAKISYEREE